MNNQSVPRADAARRTRITVADLESALRAGGPPDAPADLHDAILATLERTAPAPRRARAARAWMVAAASLSVLALVSWAPVGRALRVRRLARAVHLGNARLAGWLGEQIEQGHSALHVEGELFLADMRTGTRFLVERLPFGAGVLAAVRPEMPALPGGAP